MTPCPANSFPEVAGPEPLPPTKPPPCIHTMTGSLAPGLVPAGSHKLRYRQSSDEPSVIDPGVAPHPACAQSVPNSLASRTPSHAGTGWGGRQRYSPTGGAAYGIPFKAETSPSVTPRTTPDLIRTVDISSSAAEGCAKAHCALIMTKSSPMIDVFIPLFLQKFTKELVELVHGLSYVFRNIISLNMSSAFNQK